MSLNFRDINDLLLLKSEGVFEIRTAANGKPVIMVYGPGNLGETIFCLPPGHANQVRQELTDMGLSDLVGDAL